MKNHANKRGQTSDLQIKRLGINGEGIGYWNNTICFVPGALPQETVTASIDQVYPNYLAATLKKIKRSSPDRRIPACPVYEKCGGCQLQHLAYRQQRRFKQDLIRQALEKFKPTGFRKFELRPTLGMQTPWHYRNKAQFQLRENKLGAVESGLYQTDSHQLVAIDNCPVQHPVLNETLTAMTKLIQQLQIPVYNEKKHSGIIKTIVARIAFSSQKVQVVLVCNSKKMPRKKELIAAVQHTLPQVVSLMQNIQPEKSSLIMGDETLHLWGVDQLEERLGTQTFDLSPRAFFQLNPLQTEVLYHEVRRAAEPQAGQKVIDAYCGAGTIGLSLAAHVKEVRGMDTIPAAIDDAKHNAAKQQAHSTFYTVGPAEKVLPTWVKEGFHADTIIVDPPRTGLDQALLTLLTNQPAKRLVYVSCNPSTFARDLVQLVKSYRVDYLQPIDMFPQTARSEIVARLTRKS